MKNFILGVLLMAVIAVVAASFMGIEPFSSWKSDLFNSCDIGNPSGPHGTYSATILGYTETIKFSGNTLTLNDPLSGKRTFTYVLAGNGTQIQTTDVVTGKKDSTAFYYIPEHDIVVFLDIQFQK